ncbi:helix-turn-helix domain-containing protein [Ruegeria marina]|uniref:HTH DNA binding domain-containing protein n=1 Tax=Ruegeria marina TaxID=639004 RepID=A0A1G6UU01_9RHOB|nr:helix-turn-helix domain-containing protein [Ruegeria marina]SDD44890.1 HTH DNA binding domain-containing protein [Ruegeria marina]
MKRDKDALFSEPGPDGPYDADQTAEDDLWFLPGPDGEEAADFLSPRRAAPPRLFDPGDWRAAQAALAPDLADLAVQFGALDERLRAGHGEWVHRLALLEVADLGWWAGDRISAERLALWTGLRLGATGDDTQALARAGWAVRRLCGGPAPADAGWQEGLADFLGRSNTDGDELPETVADLAEVMQAADGLHPATGAAMMFHAWMALGQGPSTAVEAAVLAARHGAAMARGSAVFLPLALSGPGALRGAGSPQQKLAAWLRGSAQAVVAALLHLERIAAWRARAIEATADLSGRTPPALIDVMTAWPIVTAPLAEAKSGASRAAVQRNLDLFARRGLIREMTGQGRYRVWTAAV